jgi:hypothetical protein
MTREQYIQTLQRELQKLNKEIDMKIISGEKYVLQAKEHKLLLKRIYQHTGKNSVKSFFSKFFSPSSLQF